MGGTTELTLDFLPAAAILVALYFFLSRALFYFSLLVRNKLESAEKILILRWEISSYLLTLIASTIVVATLAKLEPGAWVAVALALGVVGLLARQILDEAIGAEDLNKVHLMEAAIASNATLQGSFTQIERLGYRLARLERLPGVPGARDRRFPWSSAARWAGPIVGEPPRKWWPSGRQCWNPGSRS